jgi:large subunit ribosomal protein L18
MSDKNSDKATRLERRKWSIRNGGVFGTTERPRLSVYRSGKHIYAQVIDDYAAKTLAFASTTQTEVRGDAKTGANVASAQKVGRAFAE